MTIPETPAAAPRTAQSVVLARPDPAQKARWRRQHLEELLAATCKHLHTPEACMWCIQEQLNTDGPEIARPTGRGAADTPQ